jgi:hypothetical protein
MFLLHKTASINVSPKLIICFFKWETETADKLPIYSCNMYSLVRKLYCTDKYIRNSTKVYGGKHVFYTEFWIKSYVSRMGYMVEKLLFEQGFL